MKKTQQVSSSSLRSAPNSEHWGKRLAYALWIAAAVVAVAVLLGSLKGYSIWFHGRNAFPPAAGQYSVFNILSGLVSLTTALVCLFLSLILFMQKRQEPMALFVSFYVMIYGIVFAGPLENLNPLFPGASAFAISRAQPLLLTATVGLMILLPDGRPVPSWTRWLIPVSLLSLIFLPFTDADSLSKANTLPVQLLAASWIILYGIAFGAQVYRYRRVSTPEQQEQTRWVVFGLIAWIILLVLQGVPFIYLQNLPPGTPQPGWAAASASLWWLTLSTIPVTLSIATLRYRLYDIDLIINRTLVYGALTAILAGLYSASISLFQKVFVALTGSKSDAAIVLTTLILASTFTPIKTRLQAVVDRRYKEVHDPLRRLADFSKQIDDGIWMIDPRLALGRLLEVAVAALGASSGVVTWFKGGEEHTVATHGNWTGESSLTTPLVIQDRLLGRIILGPRTNGAAYAPLEFSNLSAAVAALTRALAATIELPPERAP
jgi:hypothetical protein